MKKTILLLLILIQGFSQKYDLGILNGRIVDGTSNPWYLGDVGVKNGKIAFIGKISPSDCKETFDAKRQVVCPGFIDVHTHIETSILKLPMAESFILDGVTSLITGNCGSSEVDLKKFFDTLITNGFTPNVASLIGHNSVRRAVMKNVFRDPTASEQ